jgi:hypothetical protein
MLAARMREWIEELERWGADVIFGRAKGIRATLTRFLMLALSGVFRLLVQLRLWRYRSGWKPQHHLGAQVIAVGNITVGGTGKTPVVELLARSLRDQGRQVAILSRGYKSKKPASPQRWRDSHGAADAAGGFHRRRLAARLQIRRRRTVHARAQSRRRFGAGGQKPCQGRALRHPPPRRRHAAAG